MSRDTDSTSPMSPDTGSRTAWLVVSSQHVLAVAPPRAEGHRLGALVAGEPRRGRAHRFEIVGMTELEYRHANEIVRRIAEHRDADLRRVENGAGRRLPAQHVGRMVGEKAVALFALAQRDLGHLPFGDVACDGEQRRHRAVALLDVHVLADPQLAAVDRDDREFPVRDGNSLEHLLLVERDALLVMIASHELEIHSARDPGFVLAPHEPRRDRVRVEEDAVRVDAIDRVAGALDELMEARLTLRERVVDLPTFGDVARRDRDAVVDADDLVSQPAHVAGVVLEAQFVLERLAGLDHLHELVEQPALANRRQHLAHASDRSGRRDRDPASARRVRSARRCESR